MSILKAFIFTFLLILIEAILSFGFLSINEVLELSNDNLVHYGQITEIVTKLGGYFIMLSLIFKLRFDNKSCSGIINNIDVKTILFILITIIGYKLSLKPIFDIRLIIDSINNITAEPINDISEKYKYLWAYRYISAVVFAPVLEELFFRKIIFKKLLKNNSLVVSVIVSSLCFGLIHIFPNWEKVITSFIFGVFCCIIYIKTKNILYPILFHFLGNLISVTLSIYSQELFAFHQKINYNWIYWTAFVIGIGITIFGLRKITTANKS